MWSPSPTLVGALLERKPILHFGAFPCPEPQMCTVNPGLSKAKSSLGADQALTGIWGQVSQSLLCLLMVEGWLVGPMCSSG